MMKKLLIQECGSKFIQNTIYSDIFNFSIFGSIINGNLYKTFYTLNPTHIIFKAEMLTAEIMQFIQEFSTTIKCYIHHDKPVHSVLRDTASYDIKHIFSNISMDLSSNVSGILIPKNIINTKLFYDNNNTKKDSIVCFLDGYIEMPEGLTKCLYPNTKLPIKLFNAPRLSNMQNLGMTTEPVRAQILQSHKYYLSLDLNNDNYSIEAQNCGCVIVPLSEIENYTNIEYIAPKKYIDHSQFILESILS
jgi:hypothetical protein